MTPGPPPVEKPADPRSGPTPPEGRSFDVDQEDPRDGADRDRWLMENVPPHHR
jgi:hypothetical protein